MARGGNRIRLGWGENRIEIPTRNDVISNGFFGIQSANACLGLGVTIGWIRIENIYFCKRKRYSTIKKFLRLTSAAFQKFLLDFHFK